uniref:Gram-positive cocci surface proteins LPxTG domain-containing protein n=1 Tax=Streptomyces sp. NBC_00003 TaxID=2903608 RepID=A0AAU2V762_9ACTN
MYKFTGPATRAALVAGLVTVLGTGYTAYAADQPVPASPHASCAPPSGAGQGSQTGPEAAPRQHLAQQAIAAMRGEGQQPLDYGGNEDHGQGQEIPPGKPAPSAAPPKQTPPDTQPSNGAIWPAPTPSGTSTWPASTPSATASPTSAPVSPPATWTPTPTPTHSGSTPSEETSPNTPGTSPSASAPPHLAHTGADSKASLLGALSVSAVVMGAAAVALSRRASRGKAGK